MIICYAIDDAMQASVRGKAIIALENGIWYMHPDNEERFISDSEKYGFEAVRLFTTSGLWFEVGAVAMDWPELSG